MASVKQLVSELSPLPTLPDVALRAQDMLCDPNVGLMEVAKVIELDPVVSARIVRMANSPIYGGAGGREFSLNHAVMRLGTKETRSVVLTVAVMQTIPELPPPMTIHSFWCMGLASAIAARKLAEDLKYPDPDEAYLAGLVHCMGEALLATKRPEAFREAVLESQEQGCPLHDALLGEFGVPVASVSAELLREWSMPESIVEAVEYQRRPSEAPNQALLASILFAADKMCRGLGLVPESHGIADENWDEGFSDEFVRAIERLGYRDTTFYLLSQLQELSEVEALVQQAFKH